MVVLCLGFENLESLLYNKAKGLPVIKFDNQSAKPKRSSAPAAHGRGHVAETPREDEAAAEHGLEQGLAPLLRVQSEQIKKCQGAFGRKGGYALDIVSILALLSET